jgi:hypothetical protein
VSLAFKLREWIQKSLGGTWIDFFKIIMIMILTWLYRSFSFYQEFPQKINLMNKQTNIKFPPYQILQRQKDSQVSAFKKSCNIWIIKFDLYFSTTRINTKKLTLIFCRSFYLFAGRVSFALEILKILLYFSFAVSVKIAGFLKFCSWNLFLNK